MSRSVQYVSSILTHAAFLCLVVIAAHAQSAHPVLVAKFVGVLNTKSAKAGDAVIAKTAKVAKAADGKEIPKGSQVIGKVVAVDAKQSRSGDSLLAIKFDQLEVNGARFPIEGQIVAIGPFTQSDLPDNSYLGIGHSTPVLVVDPVASTLDGSGKDGLGIATGSLLPGVTIATHLNDAGAIELRGYRRDIKLNAMVLIKVRLN
jgi:hypothetical protein